MYKMRFIFVCALLCFTGIFHAIENKNRFSFLTEIANENKLAALSWMMELSESKDLGIIELSGEYSLLSRFLCRWKEECVLDLDMEHYRYYLNFSKPQTELRLGLQRLSFGSAKALRPLMWFDNINPMDVNQDTKGVKAALMRHYWLNNANLWLWGLRGTDKLKGNEFVSSRKNSLEYGGRFQYPTNTGDLGISYHQRKLVKGRECRLGFDLRMDYALGLWLEASTSYFAKNPESINYVTLASIGSDYVFEIGNGLAITLEAMLKALSHEGWRNLAYNDVTFAVMADYPLGLLDSVHLFTSYVFDIKEYMIMGAWRRTYDFITLDLSLSNIKNRGNSVSLIISAVLF